MQEVNSSLTSSDEAAVERYERLEFLYNELINELNGLHKEGFILKSQISQAIDHEKISSILNTIKNSN